MIKKDNIEELFELVLIDEEDGVFANSLVSAPAIERDFVYFNQEYTFAAVNEEKMLIAGPMLIPNKKIMRLKDNGEKYWVYFKPQTIEKIARKFMKNKLTDQITLEHGNKTSGIHMVESWIVENPAKDKSNTYGFTLPKGSWFAVYSAEENPKVWDRVKAGEFNGFSIEGLFEHMKSDVKLSLEKNIEDFTEEEAEVFLGQLKAIIRKDKRYKAKQRIEMQSYTDYPQSASNNAKRALEWADKNGWGSCGEATGKRRASQLANREPLSRDTIARMASFKRHQQHKDVPYSEGCGGLMWDSWGGTSGVEWAINKLKEIDMEAMPSIPASTYPGQSSTQRKKKDDK